jgi:hypothetical protein
MKRFVCAATFWFVFLTCPLLAVEPFTPPKTATPSIAIVRKVNREKGEVTLAVMALLPEKDKQKGDKLRPPKPPKMRRELQEFTANLAGFRFLTAGGKKLDEKGGWNRLRVGRTIVVTSDPRGIDDVFRKVLADDALMLVPDVTEEGHPEADSKGNGPGVAGRRRLRPAR